MKDSRFRRSVVLHCGLALGLGLALSGFARPRFLPATFAPGPTPDRPSAASAPGLYAPAVQPTYRCRRAPGAIRIDGVLNDRGWRRAALTDAFLNWNAKGIPQYPTTARLAWDAAHLYVAFHCKDADISSSFRRRDDPLYEQDVVEIFLSMRGYPKHYYEFEVSPGGVLMDARVFKPGPRQGPAVDKTWNAGRTKVAARVDGTLNRRGDRDRSWTAEMAIPFADLGRRGPPAPGERWRVNLYRIDPGPETSYATWSPTLGKEANYHTPERFGFLEFAR